MYREAKGRTAVIGVLVVAAASDQHSIVRGLGKTMWCAGSTKATGVAQS